MILAVLNVNTYHRVLLRYMTLHHSNPTVNRCHQCNTTVHSLYHPGYDSSFQHR